jgi:hypothetical protein
MSYGASLVEGYSQVGLYTGASFTFLTSRARGFHTGVRRGRPDERYDGPLLLICTSGTHIEAGQNDAVNDARHPLEDGPDRISIDACARGRQTRTAVGTGADRYV